ncbi:hypothetical protein J2X11_001434 [Aeromicrobium panaciterrae]|uniref:DUF2510 domain-containing protein n=1 Tax=Aeromicrobium panaciterrae TaxID=363861 RepID=A0ABU1UN25_9ACTN|nr:DUF2510 domain-containing protein [Aeromicrobium panaciterrae]MDR7086595.1 hypothetical protein [Aeromicrobium panaciterrae]
MSEAVPPTGASKPPAGFYPNSGRMQWWDGNEWTEHFQADVGPLVGQATSEPKKKKKRVFLWVFMAVQVLFIVWVVGGASTGSGNPSDCGSLDLETCNAASDVGTSIGVALIVAFWVVVDFLMAVVYGVYRLARRN